MTNSLDQETQERMERFIASQVHLQAMIKIAMMRDRRALEISIRCLRACRAVLSKFHRSSGTVAGIERRIEVCESALGTNKEVQALWEKLYSIGSACKSREQYERCVDNLTQEIESARQSFSRRFFKDAGTVEPPENVIATDRVGHA